MAVKSNPKTIPDTYFELVKRHPLARIHDDKDLKNAHTVIDRLLREELDSGAQRYLDALTDLVEIYEERHVAIPDAPEADVLRELMRQRGWSQAKLAAAVGISQSTLSDLVNGNRPFTSHHAVALGRFFQVSPAVFLPGK